MAPGRGCSPAWAPRRRTAAPEEGGPQPGGRTHRRDRAVPLLLRHRHHQPRRHPHLPFRLFLAGRLRRAGLWGGAAAAPGGVLRDLPLVGRSHPGRKHGKEKSRRHRPGPDEPDFWNHPLPAGGGYLFPMFCVKENCHERMEKAGCCPYAYRSGRAAWRAFDCLRQHSGTGKTRSASIPRRAVGAGKGTQTAYT